MSKVFCVIVKGKVSARSEDPHLILDYCRACLGSGIKDYFIHEGYLPLESETHQGKQERIRCIGCE